MELAVFESVVIESVLNELEEEGKKYTGLYVDMNNAPERKYVKDKAALIGTIKKKVERVRVDAAKAYKIEVEKQAAAIHERLDGANEPFQALIDIYTLERKVILDTEKARKQLILDTEKLLAEHDHAIIMNQVWDLEIDKRKADKEKAAAEQEAAIKLREEQAAARAVEMQKAISDAEERDRINAENARLANKEHIQEVKTGIYKVLVQFGLSSTDAKTVIHLATIKELPNLTINY